MLLVERIARAQRPCELGKDLRQQAIMKVNHRLSPILAGRTSLMATLSLWAWRRIASAG
jgi:hypothetical protein